MAAAFASSSSSSSLPTGPVDITVLQSATRVLHEQFATDIQIIPDLGETLNTQPPSYSIFDDDFRVPFQKRKLVGIPDALFQHYSNTNVNTRMGLMPEIERTWISVENKLLLWDYIEGNEISSFEDQPYVISNVALVKPKKGLFIDEISYLLVICTPMTVVLIGVALFLGAKRKTLQLYATDLTVNTDTQMSSVIGTSDGRIFMAGSHDGSLYELHYQAIESWFGKRVQLINHSVGGMQSLIPRFVSSNVEDRIVSLVSDDVRRCFYTLTERNAIAVYKPTSDKSLEHVQTLSGLYKSVQDKALGSPAVTPQNFRIIAIHPVDFSESRSGIQLVAITSTGVRLYFGPAIGYAHSYGGYSSTSGGVRPLQLLHVRLPPTDLSHPDEQEPTSRQPVATYNTAPTLTQQQVRMFTFTALDVSCYVDGLTVAAQETDVDGKDFLLCMSPDLTRIGNLDQTIMNAQSSQRAGASSGSNRASLSEYAALLAIPGRTWAMAPVPQSSPNWETGLPAPVVTNELASQFVENPREIMVLTNVGLTFLMKRRALDYLRAVIEEVQSEGNVQPLVEFRNSFGRNQTCAMLLGLASDNSFLDTTESTSNVVIPPDIAAVAKQAFYDFGERPIWSERTVYSNEAQGKVLYSGRRDGFALYFARLVRRIWKSKLTRTSAAGIHEPTVPEAVLVTVQRNLYSLKDLLDKNPHLFHSSPGDSAVRAPAAEQQAWKAEQSSVVELMSLLTRTIEALSFILLLTDHRIGDLITRCAADVQSMFKSLTFEDLIITHNGMTVSRALVNVVIDQQIGQQLSVDTISEVLQQRCGSFCSSDDVMLYKAKENIRKAVETKNPTDRDNWLSESLRLYIKGARILDLQKLREICGDFQQLTYAKGAVDLPLVCANVFDAENIGLEYWAAGMPANDVRKEFYERRLHCYELVLDSLNVFEGSSQAANSFSRDDQDTVRSHAYEYAFTSRDEMFHSTLYDWLIDRGLADDLLEIRPTFLESHLRREPATVKKYQLLWQYYVKDGQPLRAAEVLSALAESTEFDLHLTDRLECLTLAAGNAKSHPVSSGGRHETAIAFLTDLEERLDVAQVQLDIYNYLLPHIEDAEEVGERIKQLDQRLFTISELYQDYAIPFDLADLKLLCIHVSEHRDESTVRPIWMQIFDEIIQEVADENTQADRVMAKVVKLGRRFFPSESAFPLRLMTDLLVRFSLERKGVLPYGWAPRVLVQCGVPFIEIWEILNGMYESHIPPFNSQANVQAISSDIAVVLVDWLEEARRPNSSVGRGEVPVGRIDAVVDQYLKELNVDRKETKSTYENAKRLLRRNW
ncbi:nucleoporin [Guyanagaster necrorhizus]|uniref:Nucleoporin n=1 Tax=Guyanagaster necrorhizus TaxID=856835 RepID=A0A9P7W1T7_9AGAR|nr:nucleoporin [Guyanagaster necrorhizus MCA 3950]KAG7450597.1 nucleoporin [Guyanagaster necrorhizus MCA 3950]